MGGCCCKAVLDDAKTAEYARAGIDAYRDRPVTDDYTVEAYISEGMFGKVHRVRSRSTDRLWAMKVQPRYVCRDGCAGGATSVI